VYLNDQEIKLLLCEEANFQDRINLMANLTIVCEFSNSQT